MAETIPEVAPASGKLGILTPGMGAVATTFYAGTLSVRKGYSLPIGSLTQMAHIRLGKRTEKRNPMIKDFLPLSRLEDLEFGGWDPYSDDAYTSAMKAGVLQPAHLEAIGEELRTIQPMPAVFSPDWVRRLEGYDQVKDARTKMDLAELLMEDIERFRTQHECERLVMIWCGSTEVYREPAAVHQDLEAFEKGLKISDPGDGRTGRAAGPSYLRQGLQDRTNADENDDRPGTQSPDAGDQRVVLDQYSRQP
jgi:myo-inositol-1-phosphate synthase